MKGKMTVIKPGLFTSLQDLGRKGYRNLAIPNGGALDLQSAKKANLLLNNAMDAPVLECTQLGPLLAFDSSCQLVISGAQVTLKLNGQQIETKRILNINPGDQLDLQRITAGNRIYIAIKNGFDAPLNFGSCSPIAGLSSKMRVEKNVVIGYQSFEDSTNKNASLKANRSFDADLLECLPGPEFDLLTADQKQRMETAEFSIPATANRMAFPLKSETNFLQNNHSILTSPVIPGTVQLTPSGQLIVLMRDAQTTGGYPRVLTLPEKSIDQLAQLRFNQKFRMKISN